MDNQLKQRLVGAAVIIGLAVIFVPMLLDGPVESPEPQRSTGVPLVLPEEPPAPLRAERPVREAQQERPGPEAEPAPEPAPAPAEASPEDAGWAVQLGSFSSGDNAEALAARVRERGLDAFVQRVEVGNGTMYRVRIGPFGERDEAERMVGRVRDAIGERAVVVTHP